MVGASRQSPNHLRLQWYSEASGISCRAFWRGRRGREAEGGGLLNRYRVVKLVESPLLRQVNLIIYCNSMT